MEVISKENYLVRMEREVIPLLGKCRHCGYFHPEGEGEIYYERYWREQAEGAVVIVHGFSESAEKYMEMIYYFFQAGYRVYISDVRGHGRSVRAGRDLSLIHIDRYETYLSDLECLAERIVRKENPQLPLYLYGHSMGGGIAAAYLEKNPNLFQKAILSSPMIRLQTGGVPFCLAHLIAYLQVKLGNGQKYAIGQHGFRADETFEDSASVSRERFEYYYKKRLTEKRFQTSGASYGWIREAARLSVYVLKRSNCSKIQAKILMFQAEKEDYVDRKAQERFAGQVEGVCLKPVPGTKHEIYMSGDDALRTYVEDITAFLQMETG